MKDKYDMSNSPLLNPIYAPKPPKVRGIHDMHLETDAWAERIYDKICEMSPGEERHFLAMDAFEKGLPWCKRLRYQLERIRKRRVYLATCSGNFFTAEEMKTKVDPLCDVALWIRLDRQTDQYFVLARKQLEEAFDMEAKCVPETPDQKDTRGRQINPDVFRLVKIMKEIEFGKTVEYPESYASDAELISLKKSLHWAAKRGYLDINVHDFYITIRRDKYDGMYRMKIKRSFIDEGGGFPHEA